MAIFRDWRKDKGTPQLLRITPKGTQYFGGEQRGARAKKAQSLDFDVEVDTLPVHDSHPGLVKSKSIDPTSQEFERRAHGRRALTPDQPPTHSRTPPPSPTRSHRPRIQIVPLMEPKRPVSPTNRPRSASPTQQSPSHVQKPRAPLPYSGSVMNQEGHTPKLLGTGKIRSVDPPSYSGPPVERQGGHSKLAGSKSQSVDVVEKKKKVSPVHRKVTPPPTQTTPPRNIQIVPLMEPKRLISPSSPPPPYDEIGHRGHRDRAISTPVDPDSLTSQASARERHPQQEGPTQARIVPLMTPKKPSPVGSPLGEAPTAVQEKSKDRTPGRKRVAATTPLGPRAVASNDKHPQRVAGRRIMDQQGGLGPAPMSSN